MPITLSEIENLAPDQASLKAASKLTTLSKWPLLQQNSQSNLIWGECQGSGSNPYRVVVDESDQGYKCTCPSRKFPCKHALALMWIRAEGKGDFGDAEVPDWVNDWLGRRRKTTNTSSKDDDGSKTAASKNIAAAQKVETEKQDTPEQIARKKAAAEKRAAEKQINLAAGVEELENWIADQTRLGLGGFIDDASQRCRTIAARLVDYKAQALAGRLDELPSVLLDLPIEERVEASISELGKLVLLCRAWSNDRKNPQLLRMIATSETRDQVLENKNARRRRSWWEVVGERIRTRRDGLVSHSTWLMDIKSSEPEFALLLDFYPASSGKRGQAFVCGDRFEAELVFYPGDNEQRAIIAERVPAEAQENETKAIEASVNQDLLQAYRMRQNQQPWERVTPLGFSEAQLIESENGINWLQAGSTVLPVVSKVPKVAYGLPLQSGVGLWDGRNLDLLSAKSAFGTLEFDS